MLGYDRFGFDVDGYDRDGFDRSGYNRDGFDRSGFDRQNYDRRGFHRFTRCNREGFDRKGVHYSERQRQKTTNKQQKKQERAEAQRLLNDAIEQLRSTSRQKSSRELWPLFEEMAAYANITITSADLPNDALRKNIYRAGALLLHPDTGGDEAAFKAFSLLNQKLKKQLYHTNGEY